jgi:hypothetical protein
VVACAGVSRSPSSGSGKRASAGRIGWPGRVEAMTAGGDATAGGASFPDMAQVAGSGRGAAF